MEPISDLVTITCTRDRGIQRLQSYSLDLMIKDPCDHYVVIEDRGLTLDEWQKILSPYYTRHRLHLIPSMIPEKYYPSTNGWTRQQVLKLLIAEKINGKRYLLLDSKNFFVHNQSLSQWPVNNGNGIIQSYNSFDWEEINEFCAKHNIPISKEIYMSCTPFVCDTHLVKEILKFDIFPLFFEKKNWWSSEILLYSIFSQFFGNTLKKIEHVPNVTFWSSERVLSTETLRDIYSWPDLRMFGLHRAMIYLKIDLFEFIRFLIDIGYDRDIVTSSLKTYKQDNFLKII
jgi:hypothetical protein